MIGIGKSETVRYTEDNVSVRTLFISKISISISKQMLCDYFRQYGAIERVQILPERHKMCDMVPPLIVDTNNSLIDGRNFFAYVTFVNCFGAFDALDKDVHEIQNQILNVQAAFSWHQPASELATAPRRPTDNITARIDGMNQIIFREIDEWLNDDCILEVMKHLSTQELLKMAAYSHRFLQLAQRRRTMKITCDDCFDGMTMMRLREILRLHGYGYSLVSLTISQDAFKVPSSAMFVFEKLNQYLGPQLMSLTLKQFNVTTEQFDQIRPVLLRLEHLDINLNYDFDYSKFNAIWPRLKTLCIKSSGSIQVLNKNSRNPTNFPNLKKLVLSSSYKLDETLFETIGNNLQTLDELVIINVEDYYSELPHSTRTDFRNLNKLKQLTKLHLSFGRHELNFDAIALMTSLKQLTLDVTNNRPHSNSSFVRIPDQHMEMLAKQLENLTEIRFSGYSFSENGLEIFIRNARLLKEISIHNSDLYLSAKFVRVLATARRSIHHSDLVALKMSVDGIITADVQARLIRGFVKQYLVLAKAKNPNMINDEYGVNAVMRNPLRIRRNPRPALAIDPEMPRAIARDYYRLRNRIFLFRP